MRSEALTLENMSTTLIDFRGFKLTYWHRVIWPDGFFQVAQIEVETPSGASRLFKIGRDHPWGATTERRSNA